VKVEGKDIFTVKSACSGNPEMKPEAKDAVDHILYLMKKCGITKVEL